MLSNASNAVVRSGSFSARKVSHAPKKEAMIRARMTLRLKKDHLGLSPSEAINFFYRQICLRRGLPFAVEIPNEITLRTLKKTDHGEDLIHTESEDEFFKKLRSQRSRAQTLVHEEPLEIKHRDHKLVGNWKDRRDCHVEPDWVLIYKPEPETERMIFERTGTHSDLFR